MKRTAKDNSNKTGHLRGPIARAVGSLSLLAVASILGFTPASTLADVSSAASNITGQPTSTTKTVGHAADTGGTDPGSAPPPHVGVPAMDASTGWVFPVKQAHQMLGPSSWSLDQGVDMGFGLGFRRSFCGSKAELVAVDDGVITQVGLSGFGSQSPVLKLTSGRFKGRRVYYGHSQPTVVKKGQRVTRGQVISHIGCGIVGLSSAPHVEFGLYARGAAYCCPSQGETSGTVLAILKRMFPKAVAASRKRH